MPPTVLPVSLAGVASKHRWAYEHLQHLDAYAFNISRNNGKFVGMKEDAEAGKRIYYLLRDPVIDLRFLVETGMILQALRSALDHLAYVMCVAGPGGEDAVKPRKVLREIYFPICRGSADEYKELPSRTVVIRLAKPGVEDALDAIQPYSGGRGRILTVLKALNDTDKHRLLLGVALQRPSRDNMNTKVFDPEKAAFIRLMRRIPIMIGGVGLLGTQGGPLKAGDEIFRESLDGKTDEEVNFSFPVSLNEPEILKMEPVPELLHKMAEFVGGIIGMFSNFV
jgi:hypothetical protein